MRKKLIDNLYVGNLEDCELMRENEVSGGWSIIHACRNPCFCAQEGGKPNPDEPDYLVRQKGVNLYLNMIDPPTPMFQMEMFERFLEFATEAWENGQKLLIHCNKGVSRAPSLALLFMAKVLHRITNQSFDEAWDEFQEVAQEEFTPSLGIETWLRENWEKLKPAVKRPPAIDTSAGIPGILPPGFVVPDDPDVCYELCRTQPLIHFTGFVDIEMKDHQWRKPTPNTLQFQIAEAYNWCMENRVPCRLIILKPRQVGCSTFCVELCYHHMRNFRSDWLIMGDVSKRTQKIWELLQGTIQHDSFDWDSTIIKSNTEKIIMRYSDGEEGAVNHETAMDEKAGISGTRQIILWTEAARYMKVNGRDKKVMTASLFSLANTPESLGVMESTAEGANGFFYDTWQEAIHYKDRKRRLKDDTGALIIGNGWLKVFAAWFEFKEHALKRTPENAQYFSPEMDQRERRGIDLYGWSDRQIAWRRMMISRECGGDVRIFDQDFPEDSDGCFLASGRPRFNAEGLAHLEAVAKVNAGRETRGVLEENKDGGVVFQERGSEEAYVWVAERPKAGLRYVSFIDPCTGAQSEGSQYPDAHAAGIIRAGYFDDRNIWQNTRVVATIDVPNGCRWDDELIAEKLDRLSKWYGGCEIIVEANKGLGVIAQLQKRGANLYEREKQNAMYPGKRLKVPGWDTNNETRPLVVNELANYIREQTLDCTYSPAIQEMRNFIVNDRGKAEAKNGKHDDWVLGIGIGLFCIDHASQLMPEKPDLWHETHEREFAALPGGLNPKAFS